LTFASQKQMESFCVLLASMGSLNGHRGKSHGGCYVFFVMKTIYRGCVEVTSMKPCIAMNKSEAMRGRNGAWKVLRRLCITMASEIWATLVCPTPGITDDKVL
jgi:hypothetical protein